MRGLLLRTQRDGANLVGPADLFQRPANAHVARKARPAVGLPVEGGDDDGHGAETRPASGTHRLRLQKCDQPRPSRGVNGPVARA